MLVIVVTYLTVKKIGFKKNLRQIYLHMATNRPQGGLVGWRINMKHFQLEKTIEISFLEKNPILLMSAVRFEPTTSQLLSGIATPRLT